MFILFILNWRDEKDLNLWESFRTPITLRVIALNQTQPSSHKNRRNKEIPTPGTPKMESYCFRNSCLNALSHIPIQSEEEVGFGPTEPHLRPSCSQGTRFKPDSAIPPYSNWWQWRESNPHGLFHPKVFETFLATITTHCHYSFPKIFL